MHEKISLQFCKNTDERITFSKKYLEYARKQNCTIFLFLVVKVILVLYTHFYGIREK